MSHLTYRDPLTPEDRETFLACLREGTSIRDACRKIGRSHAVLYRIRNGRKDSPEPPDEEFAAAWDAAAKEGKAIRKDVLQDVVYQIALSGEKDSDRLKAAEIELKRLAPEEYRDNVRHEHAGGLEVTSPDVAAALDRFTATLRQLAQRQHEPRQDLRLAADERAAIAARAARG